MRQPTPHQLAQALDVIVTGEGDVTDPNIAKKRCITVSKLFGEFIGGGRLIAAYGPRDVTGPSDAPGHVALMVGRTVYDWTARQFWPDVPCPLIEPVEAWALRFTGDRIVPNRPLVETYDELPPRPIVATRPAVVHNH